MTPACAVRVAEPLGTEGDRATALDRGDTWLSSSPTRQQQRGRLSTQPSTRACLCSVPASRSPLSVLHLAAPATASQSLELRLNRDRADARSFARGECWRELAGRAHTAAATATTPYAPVLPAPRTIVRMMRGRSSTAPSETASMPRPAPQRSCGSADTRAAAAHGLHRTSNRMPPTSLKPSHSQPRLHAQHSKSKGA